MNDEVRWSPYPREACAISLDADTRVGFGVHPAFDIVPGAWNIFWLTFAQLDQLAYYKGDVNEYIITCDALAVCVGAALQQTGKGTMTIGDMATTMRPKGFIEIVANSKSFLPVVFYGERWFNVAKARSEAYRDDLDNVIRIDFRKGKET